MAIPEVKKIGLSLSGGGYRAAAFHVGTLSKLNQLNILDKIDVLSTISGGSITGAYYCLSKDTQDFATFEKEVKGLLAKKSVVKYVLCSLRSIPGYIIVIMLLGSLFVLPFTKYSGLSVFVFVATLLIILLFQFKVFPVSRIIEMAYDQFFFKGAVLSGLCEKPLLVIGATNIQTCRQFSFSRTKMEDSSYSYDTPPVKFKQEQFPVSRAVMASSSVPFAFTPVTIDKAYYQDEKDQQRIDPQLVDGGVYDNQGIHRLTQKGYYECSIIMTSDAGNKLPFAKAYNNAFVLILRTMDVFMMRIKNFQMMQNIYANTTTVNKEIAYFSLGWDVQNCISGFINNLAGKKVTTDVIESHKIPDEWVMDVARYRNEIQQLIETNVGYDAILSQALNAGELLIARKVGTNLTRLSEKQVDLLSRHASNLTELQVKLYCPSLLSQG